MTAGVFRGPGLAAIAAMSLAMLVGAGVVIGALAISKANAARAAAAPLERVVRLLDPDNENAMRALVQRLQQSPDVAAAAPLTVADLAMLMPPDGAQADIAMPLRLVAVSLHPNAPADAGERLQADLADQGLSVDIAAPGPDAKAAADDAQSTRQRAVTIAAAIAATMVIVVVWIAYLAAASKAAPARVLALLGATRGQTLARIAGPAFAAGLVAGIAALCALAGLSFALHALNPGLLDPIWPLLRTPDRETLTVMVTTPFIAALAARSGARAAASRAYAEEGGGP